MSEHAPQEAELANEYQKALDAILSVELTPEIIDHYAEQALDNLIALVGRVVEQYNPYVVGTTEHDAAVEAAAFHHFGLGDIEATLSHLAAQVEELHNLDDLIAAIEPRDMILVPSDHREAMAVRPGDGSFSEKATQQRTKTALFILGSAFDVNVRDSQQFTLTTGITTVNMMRRVSYNLIHAPALQRAILICDEVENATYVFDTDALQQTGVTVNELALLSKSELNTLLRAAPDIGQRFIFSKAFVRQLAAALESPATIIDTGTSARTDKQQARYLYPKAPEGTLSATGYARSKGIDERFAKRAVKACAQLLGPAQKYQFGPVVTGVGYNQQQQRILDEYVDKHRQKSSTAPNGYLSTFGMHKHPDFHGVSTLAIESTIKELGDELDDVDTYLFGSTETNGYSPKQQQRIWRALDEKGLFSPEATDDILPIHKTIKELGFPRTVVLNAIDDLGEQLGTVRNYHFGPRVVIGYTPRQREIIRDYVVRTGKDIPKAPDDIRSAYGISSEHEDLSQYLVERAIEQLGDTLQPRGPYLFGSQVTVGYSPEQQALIIETARHRKR